MLDHPRRERMLNVPAAVVALLALLVLVHAVVMLALTADETTEFLLLFAFIPALRPQRDAGRGLARGWAADVWTFITYSSSTPISPISSSTPCGFSPSPRRWRSASARCASPPSWPSLRRRGRAPFHPLGRALADGWRLGRDFRRNGAATRFVFQRGHALGFWRDPEEAARAPALPLAARPARSARAGIRGGVVRCQPAVRRVLPRHAGRRTGDRLAGAHRRIPRGPPGLRGVRSDPHGARAGW